MIFTKKYKKIYKEYQKKFKNFNLMNDNILEHLIEYLTFLRDYYILTLPKNPSKDEELLLNSVATALSEYSAWKNCINKYYDTNGNILAKDKTKEEIDKLYRAEKTKHWSIFWQLVTFNIEELTICD